MNGTVDLSAEVVNFTSYTDFKEWCAHSKAPRGYAKALSDCREESARDLEYKRERRQNIFQDGDPIEESIVSPALLNLRFDALLPPRQSLVIVGPAGSGKVRWALENSPKPIYIVRSKDDLRGFKDFLKRFPGYIKSMLFIQMDFRKYPYNEQRNRFEEHSSGAAMDVPLEMRRA
ncbi:hypothetical protein HDU88_007973 [Geranomyces variabilis]|nr:hypothetical protein HDU88_007973 [Geranomyces variabilis]